MDFKLSLRSGFSDYYDLYFDRESADTPIWHRSPRLGRGAQMDYLSHKGCKVPRSGALFSLQEHGVDNVVIRTDKYGPILVPLLDNIDNTLQMLHDYYGGLPYTCLTYAQEYIAAKHPALLRYQIGDIEFWVEESSSNAWATNRGKSVRKLISGPHVVTESWMNEDYPISCTRYLDDAKGYRYAIEFDTAPVLIHSGIDYILPGGKVVDLIKMHVQRMMIFYDQHGECGW